MSSKDSSIASVLPMTSSRGEKSPPEPSTPNQSISTEATTHSHRPHLGHRANSETHSETHSIRSTGRKHRSWWHYWASITPLICGALGPVLTLLALSGCADRWRLYVTDNGVSMEEKDPKWVIAVTALAIMIGMFANILLLLRMLGRGNPKHLQIIAIVLWLLECTSLLLVSLSSCFTLLLYTSLFVGKANLSGHEFHDNWDLRRDCGR